MVVGSTSAEHLTGWDALGLAIIIAGVCLLAWIINRD